jgi:hypothetical protein
MDARARGGGPCMHFSSSFRFLEKFQNSDNSNRKKKQQ